MIKHTLFVLILVTSFGITNVTAQNRGPGGRMSDGGPKIMGKVVDKPSGHAIEYANVVLYKQSDSALVQGTVTDKNGNFTIQGFQRGAYYMEVRFMGYERFRMPDGKRVVLICRVPSADLLRTNAPASKCT